MSLFGGHATPTPSTMPHDNGLHRGQVSGPVDIACVGAAVAARENALDSAMLTETAALNSAYSTRASALVAAFAQTDTASVKSATKAAWQAFNASTQAARKAWRTSQQATWATYRNAAKQCKGATTVTDSANASTDAGTSN
ncbi:MAG TPA: hypothetical protein VN495_01100 [Candidatus Paceibacterota bacterium]|nr:hypothetical protein [Candidatus Paceibacterota bacterium]